MEIPDFSVPFVNDLNAFGHGYVIGSRPHFREELDSYRNGLMCLDHLVKLRGQWKDRVAEGVQQVQEGVRRELEGDST